MSTDETDTQRELEQRALKNVRGLVDRAEADEDSSRRSQKRLIGVVAVLAVVLVGAIIAVTQYKREPVKVLTSPAKAPASQR